MQDNVRKTIWRSLGLIVILLPVSFAFPLALIFVGFFAWTVYEDLKSSQYSDLPPPRTWLDAKPEDSDWLELFCFRCESLAEEKFLRVMVWGYNLKPSGGKLISSDLTLELQVEFSRYRFDFLANGCQVIEIDGAAYHSAPEEIERDRVRDEFSLQNGYKVLRIPARVVFNSPDETIRRVRAAISSVPKYTKPQGNKPEPTKKTVAQNFNSFFEALNQVTRRAMIINLKREAMADIRSAIKEEEVFLNCLVRLAELDQRVESMSAQARAEYREQLDRLEVIIGDGGSLKEMYKWREISKPKTIDDVEAQLYIETEYVSVMKERRNRILEIRNRCQNDPKFAQFFSHKLQEAKYPVDRMRGIFSSMQLIVYGNWTPRI